MSKISDDYFGQRPELSHSVVVSRLKARIQTDFQALRDVFLRKGIDKSLLYCLVFGDTNLEKIHSFGLLSPGN